MIVTRRRSLVASLAAALAAALAAGLAATLIFLLPLGSNAAALASPATSSAVSDYEVRVDLRVTNIYGFSTRDKTFTVEGKYWLTFSSKLEQQMRAKNIKPIQLISLYNNIRPWDSRVLPIYSIPEKLANNQYRIGYEFNGLFYSNTIDYTLSPFGKVPLFIVLESNDDMLDAGAGRHRLTMTPGIVEVGSRVNIDGYRLQNWTYKKTSRPKASRLEAELGGNSDWLTLRLNYSVDFWAALVKWMLPLIISMLVILLTPQIASSMKTERLAIPPVVLLTIVLMQQSYRESLPTLPYLTFLDGLYAYSYLVTLAIFLSFIWSANRVENADDRSRALVLRQVNRLDHWMQLVAISGYAVLLLAWTIRAQF